MYLLQMTKTIYSPKTNNQNNFCSGTPLKTCRPDAEIPPKEHPALRDWLASELLAPFVMFWPNTREILPKVWSPPYRTSQIRASERDDGKIQTSLPLFRTLCLWFGIVSVGVHGVSVQQEEEGEKKRRNSWQSDFLKANMWPVDEKFLLWN